MTVAENLLERTVVYRMWQAPFAAQKFAPILSNNNLRAVRRVLDVGCGPGTNAQHFAHTGYLGIDVNQRYIQHARRRHGRTFIAADVLDRNAISGNRFDFILVNSFLHHLDSNQVGEILSRLRETLSDDGHVHILELVLPEDPSISRLLARWDRGKFPRPLAEWRSIFSRYFEPVLFSPYSVGMGASLWNMVYFKGKARA
jgi:SAM-dependent methyltransferase